MSWKGFTLKLPKTLLYYEKFSQIKNNVLGVRITDPTEFVNVILVEAVCRFANLLYPTTLNLE